MTAQMVCLHIMWVAFALAMAVAWAGYLNGWPQTVMDPVGRVVGAFECVSLAAIAIGSILEWRNGHGKRS